MKVRGFQKAPRPCVSQVTRINQSRPHLRVGYRMNNKRVFLIVFKNKNKHWRFLSRPALPAWSARAACTSAAWQTRHLPLPLYGAFASAPVPSHGYLPFDARIPPPPRRLGLVSLASALSYSTSSPVPPGASPPSASLAWYLGGVCAPAKTRCSGALAMCGR